MRFVCLKTEEQRRIDFTNLTLKILSKSYRKLRGMTDISYNSVIVIVYFSNCRFSNCIFSNRIIQCVIHLSH